MVTVLLMQVVSLTEVKCPTMLEYIQGGMEMNLTISIDYTGSNGWCTKEADSLHLKYPTHSVWQTNAARLHAFLNHVIGRPETKTSLHYMNPHALNQYQTAMVEVGSILQVKTRTIMKQ